jgi:general secretion pathway protein N
LLAALAAWALGVAIVALAGFGGRYRLHPSDPALAPQLPSATVQAAQSTLGPLEMYAAAANRPLFYPDRKPERARVANGGNGADAPQPLNVLLTSVILTPSLRMAIVRDVASGKSLRVREGQPLEGGPSGWKLVAVSPRQAVFESEQGRTTLDLRVFNGQGGEPPTPNGLTPQAVSAANASNAPANPLQSGIGRPIMSPPVLGAAPVMMQQPSNDNDDAVAAQRQAEDAAARAQAEAIRQRIEARRQQAQDAATAAPPPSEKVQ